MLEHNPQVVEYFERDAFDASFEFHANEKSGHMLAVGLVDFHTLEPLNDTRFYKWINYYAAYVDGVFTPL